MDFIPSVRPIPDHIGDISFIITDYLDNTETPDSVQYEVQVLQADDSVYNIEKGDLIPYLTEAQIVWLIQFTADMRVLAQGLIPPAV